jgi:hypothetical protein
MINNETGNNNGKIEDNNRAWETGRTIGISASVVSPISDLDNTDLCV